MSNNIQPKPPSTLSTRLRCSLFLGLTLAIAVPASARQGASAGPSIDLDLEQELWGRVHYQQPGDGSLWARGRTYKASFDTDGATYYPFLGSDAPQNYPLNLRLESVRVGGTELAFDAVPRVRREGDLVELDRGSVRELYRLDVDSMEQLFVVEDLPVAGDVVIRMSVESELAAREGLEAIEFAGERGGVRYGQASAVGAGGYLTALPTRMTGGAIEIRVPSHSVSLPLVIDPRIETFTTDCVGCSTVEQDEADVAFENIFGLGVYTWEVVWSATDSDITSVLIEPDGDFVPGSTGWVDLTSTRWARPRIAAMPLHENFLIVAEKGPVGQRDIGGHVRNRFNMEGSQIAIRTAAGNDLSNPDVGGGGAGTLLADYLVVWEHLQSNGDVDLVAGFADAVDGQFKGLVWVQLSSSQDTDPQISNSSGATPLSTQRWTIVWRRNVGGQGDIYGTQISGSGSVLHSNYPIESTALSSSRPSVSSVLDGDSQQERPYLVTFDHRRPDGTIDVAARAMRGIDPVTPVTYLSNTGGAAAFSSVDSDGSSFVVAYARRIGTQDGEGWPTYAFHYALDDDEILPLEGGAILDYNFYQVWSRPKVAAEQSGGGEPGRFWIARTYHPFSASANTTVRGDLWESPNMGWSYGTPNDNSSGGPARITAHGSRSLSRAEWTLRVSGLPADRSGLFFFGPNQVNVPFGEGRRLVGGSTVRMQPVMNTGAGALDFAPSPAVSWYSQLLPGPANVNYQFWFRDPGHDGDGDGTAEGFNLSDAVSVEHTP